MGASQETFGHAVGIVGGGNAGHRLYKLLKSSRIARPAFVVDPRPDAPAILEAREGGVPTFSDVADAIRNTRTDIVFELVGRPEVKEAIQSAIGSSSTRLADHDVAYTLLAITEEEQKRTREDVTHEISQIEQEITRSLEGSRNVVSQINQIMNGLQMLALNASIEAAKVGVHGKGFMVVADHMAKSVEAVRKMTHEIEGMNTNIEKVSVRIDQALGRLR